MSRKIRFYTDEHVPYAVINGLRNRGADILTTKEAGMLGASDEEHIVLASEQARVIFTQDDDFLRLHDKGINHSGIVYTPQQTSIGDIIRGLLLINQVLDVNEMLNHLEFL